MKLLSIGLLTFLALSFAPLEKSHAQVGRNVAEYNLTSGVGLKGYDPVSYFSEGGGTPLKGETEFSLIHEGVTYFFATSKNMNTFTKAPEKYEPTYGGWCAYAMASGSKVDINPLLFTIHGNRIHFFVAARAKRNFDSDIVGHEKRADKFCKDISGEEARR